jgi:hypothetical protein
MKNVYIYIYTMRMKNREIFLYIYLKKYLFSQIQINFTSRNSKVICLRFA